MINAIREITENYNVTVDDSNIKCAVKNIELLHKEDDGFITLAAKKDKEYTQFHYKSGDLANNIGKAISLDANVYVTPNSFFIPKRKLENIRKLNALYIDIDFYKIESLKSYYHERVLKILENDYFGNDVPEPSFVLYTGNGLAVYWLIEPSPVKVLPLWNAIQRHFLKKLKDVGADANSIDAARIMRIAGGVNSKTGERAKLYMYDENLIYKLRDIQKDYLPKLTPYIKNPAYKGKTKKSKVINFYTVYSLHHARMNDIIKLLELRDGYCRNNKGELIEDGQRELMCFLYRYWACCYIRDNKLALENTLEFNQNFKKPLNDKEVKKATKKAEDAYNEWLLDSPNAIYKRGGYNYKNETLIKLLNITKDEMKYLKNIIDEYEKRSRKLEKEKADRRNEEGLTKREEAKINTINAVKELYKKGYKQVDIVKELGLSKCRVSVIIKELNKRIKHKKTYLFLIYLLINKMKFALEFITDYNVLEYI